MPVNVEPFLKCSMYKKKFGGVIDVHNACVLEHITNKAHSHRTVVHVQVPFPHDMDDVTGHHACHGLNPSFSEHYKCILVIKAGSKQHVRQHLKSSSSSI